MPFIFLFCARPFESAAPLGPPPYPGGVARTRGGGRAKQKRLPEGASLPPSPEREICAQSVINLAPQPQRFAVLLREPPARAGQSAQILPAPHRCFPSRRGTAFWNSRFLKKHGAKKVGNPPGLSTFLNVQSIKCVGTEPMFYRLHAPGSGSLCVSGRKILRREKRLQALTAPHRGYRLPPACRTGVSPHPARASVPAPTSAWR